MRKIGVVIALIVCTLTGSAQGDMAKLLMNVEYKKVNFEEIEANVLTPNSKYYYPILYARYEKGDTTLNLEDYRHLYYGYRYQQEYKPHYDPPYVDSLSQLVNRDGGVFKDSSAEKAVYYIGKILDERPFSLKYLNILTYLYDAKLLSPERALNYSYKYNMLLATIFSSGNGTDKNNPWSVMYRADAQSIFGFLGEEVNRRIYITSSCEYYPLAKRKGGIKGYYIDFDAIYSRPLEPKGKRKMEFNPLSNPKSEHFLNKKH